MEVDAELADAWCIGCVEIVEGDDEFAAGACGIGAMLIAGPNVVSVVRDDQIPVVGEQSVVGEHRFRLGTIERNPVRAAIALSLQAPRSSPQRLELRSQGGGDPRMLGKPAPRVGVSW